MESINISFSANGQQLTGGGLYCASNTVHYIIADFELGDGWQGFDSVRAVWSNDFKCISTVLDPDGSCTVPHEVLERRGKVSVNLVGSILEDGELTDRLTTYPVLAITVDANAKICGTETAEVTPSQFEQFVQIVKDEVAKVKDIDHVEMNADYTLTFYFSDGTEWTTPISIRGEQGEAGNGIASAVLNADYTLTLNFTDGTHYTTPPIRGAQGVQGETGNGIDRIELTDTTGAVKTYTIYFTDGSTYDFEVTDGEVTNAVLDEATIVQTNSDNVPYLFRQSGGDVRTGRKEFDTIVGGTVAWNQLVLDENRNFTSAMSDTRPFTLQLRMLASPYTTAFVSNLGLGKGVYTRLFVGIDTQGSGLYLTHNGSNNNIEIWRNYNQQLVVGHKYLFNVNVVNNDTTTVGGLVLNDMMLIDLTQMFGSTIADYIYSLEQANAGAGVAWFKKLFPKPYYAYNAGELMSVNTSAHNTVGFNQWDEEWEVGGIDATGGTNVSSDNKIRAKNHIPVVPNASYCITCPSNVAMRYYDSDKKFIGVYDKNNVGDVVSPYSVRTMPDNCCYLRFMTWGTYGTTYNHDICINLSWDGERDGEYEEYVKHSYPLDSDLTLRGIPKLDASNNLYYDGDVYESDGSVTRKYGIVDLGTLTWAYASDTTYPRFTAQLSGIKNGESSVVSNIVCSKYKATYTNDIYSNGTDKSIGVNSTYLWVRDTAYTDAATFKSAMNGVYLVYELATPTTETADPYTNPQIVDPSGTEEYVGSPIPVGHETDYPMTLTDTMPTANGTYTLNLTVANGKRSVSWT